MKVSTVFFSLLLGLIAYNSNAQEPFFTQFFNMPLSLNPATVGTSGTKMNAAAIYRMQWNPLGGGFNTFAASVDYATTKNLNFGAIVMNDQLGRGALSTSSLQLITGYANTLPGIITFSGALQFGFYNKRANFKDVTFVDEVLYEDPFARELTGPESAFYSNFSTGFTITTRNIWLGASWHNMAPLFFGGQPIVYTKSSNLLLEENINSYGKLSLHGGFEYKFPNTDYFTGFTMLNWRKQGPSKQFDILSGIKFDKKLNNLMTGLGYRSIYWPNDPVDLSNRDAISFFLSMDFLINSTVFRISYSYDLTVSGLSAFSGGAHEGAIVTGADGFNFKQEKKWRNWVEKHRIRCPLAYNRAGSMLKSNKKAKKHDTRLQNKKIRKIKKGLNRRN